MTVRILNKKITGLLLSLAVAGYFVACSGTTKKAVDESVMVITFVQGDARIIHTADGKEDPATIGMVVKQTDQIKTTSGTVDLQSRSGSAVRVREFTTITVAKLAGKDGTSTRIEMNHGSILASVKKASTDEDYSVVTPTAVAGVRGTTFSVEVQDGQRPKVKVVEGKVSMAPRIAALDNFTAEEIKNNKQLTKLADIQSAGEIVLEDQKEGTLDPKIEKQVMKVNEVILQAQKEDKKVEEIASLSAVSDTVDLVQKFEKNEVATVAVKPAEFSAQEQIEQQTMIVVAPEILDKVAQSSDAKAQPDNKAIEQLKEIRAQQEDIVLKKVEEVAQKENLSSDDEIKKHYNKLELIRMKNGTEIHGAVIAQTGDLMVIHSAEGVKRVKKSEVDSQEFLY